MLQVSSVLGTWTLEIRFTSAQTQRENERTAWHQ
jgi:hypothetical protein